MARIERRPPELAKYVDEGNVLPDFAAGHIQAFLESRGIVFGADGVSVRSDGTVIVVDSDASIQKLRPALDAIVPETLDPEKVKRAALLAALKAQLDEIRAKPVLLRSPAEKTLLIFVALQGIDDTPFEAAGR